jgi:hypothetical protein
MTVQYSEVSIATDPEAYNQQLIDYVPISPEYNNTEDRIVYTTLKQGGGNVTLTFASGSPFRTLRVSAASDAVSRDELTEEAFDLPSFTAVYAGAYKPSGSIDGLIRFWDFGGRFQDDYGSYYFSPFLMGIMGYQAPAAIKSNDADSVGCPTGGAAIDGWRYYLSTLPATVAIKITDVSARTVNGRGSTTVYRGVGISNTQITLAAKDFVKFTANFTGRAAEAYQTAYSSGTAISGEPAVFYNASLRFTPEGGSATTLKCNNFNISLARTIDEDNTILIGSQFKTDLVYSGVVELRGTIGLDPNEWERLYTVIAGSSDTTLETLDEGKVNFLGTVCDGTVLANAIPAGRLEVILHDPDGLRPSGYINVGTAKLTETSRSKTGQQQYTKSISYVAEVSSEATKQFYIDVFPPS